MMLMLRGVLRLLWTFIVDESYVYVRVRVRVCTNDGQTAELIEQFLLTICTAAPWEIK